MLPPSGHGLRGSQGWPVMACLLSHPLPGTLSQARLKSRSGGGFPPAHSPPLQSPLGSIPQSLLHSQSHWTFKKFPLWRHLKLLVYPWVSIHSFSTESLGVSKEFGTKSQGSMILLALLPKQARMKFSSCTVSCTEKRRICVCSWRGDNKRPGRRGV